MVKTRSQPDEEATAGPSAVHHENPPRSPSTEAPTAVASAATAILGRRAIGPAAFTAGGEAFMSPLTEMREPSTSRAAEHAPETERLRRCPSPVRSIVSNSSANARIRQAQFEAKDRLAIIEQRQLALEADRIRRRLAFDIETVNETEQDTEQPTQRVETWLEKANREEEYQASRNAEPKERERAREREAAREREDTRRTRSLTPGGTRNRGVEQLVDAFSEMARNRPLPRQAYDLPTFSGALMEWFPFKAAMRDTTKYYRLTNIENMARLRNCLKGEAKESVATMLATAEDPRLIMDTLEMSFGQPGSLVKKTLEDLKKLPRLGATAGELNKFAVKIQNCVWVLKSFDQKGYLNNPELVEEIITKLSPHMKTKWYEYAENYETSPDPEIMIMSVFLMIEAKRAMRHGHPKASNPKEQPIPTETKKSKPVYTATAEKEVLRKCPVCQQNHTLVKCGKFTNMSVAERWEIIKKERLCFKCMTSRHRRINCRAKSCGVDECRMAHHSMLHSLQAGSSTGGDQTGGASRTEKLSEESETVMTVSSSRQVKLKICPVTVSGPKGKVKTFALLDEGSTVSLLDEEIARTIGIKGPSETLRIQGINARPQQHKSQLVKFGVKGTSNEEYEIKARTIVDMKLTAQSLPQSLMKLQHLQDLDTSELCYENGKPRLLVGSDNWELIVSRELRIGKRNEPGASRTQLGWVIHGVVPRRILRQGPETVLHVMETNERLEKLVEQHFQIDALGVALKTKTRAEDERAIEVFEKTARRVEGRFEVGLSWRQDITRTPRSYEMALQRLKTLERKLDKDENLKTEYSAQIDNLLQKKYAEPCNGTETESERHWYLPHFPVINPNKPGKVRLVFDAAAKSQGVSLNDFLLDGPDLLRSLPAILFRFRENPIAVTADIKEMFLQVKIRTEDQPAQMFLWRGEGRGGETPKQYKMTSMIFGARSSPFLAHSVRDRNARDHEHRHPEAARAITESHYMDDYVDSFSRRDEAEKTILSVIEVHQAAGFQLRGWNSNDTSILTRVPEEMRAYNATQMLAGFGEQEKTLGLRWNTEKDTLGFNTSLNRVRLEVRKLTRTPTKREALSAVMSLYDPLGLLSCYTITGKIVLQKLWREKLAWDEPLPQEYDHDFTTWLEQMRIIGELQLARCYSSSHQVTKRQLHVFCDASEEAFATAVYWRLEKEDGTAEVALIAAKAKVAPLRTQTIPRLELQAAVIGTRLASAVVQGHRWQANEVTYWTDSRTVLQWITNDSVRYTPFVAHRLGEIAEATNPQQWKWIPTDLNVADLATRPYYVPATPEDRWFQGPEFLRDQKENWPQFAKEDDSEYIEPESISHLQVPIDSLPDVTRFSKFERLMRATATILLFIERCQGKRNPLEARHLCKAEKLWIQKSQSDDFGDEIELLRKQKTIPRSSRLFKLDPALKDGILVIHGRITAADVPEDMKQPMILNGRHPFTRLLIKHKHEAAGHANPERVVNDVRQQYWVLHLRPTVRAVGRECTMCRVRKSKPDVPVTGDLPAARVQPFARPFTNCGVDYFGPMVVTIGRRHEKRWGALFTCLTTRAVHLELVASLSTDSAIMALRRMAARRGWPAVIYSDNGTNFRGADTELRAAYTEWAPALRDYGLLHRVTWRFIPPGAPNQGGAWERLVRSVKVALAATMNQKSPREEVLQTLLIEAEYSINARPLTHVSVDPSDPEAITPNHFLLGSSAGLPTTGPCEPADRRTWRAAQALSDEFWRRWVREYLPTLVPRRESPGGNRPLQEGDLVVVVDATLPRNTWPRGVVQRVYPGPDGLIRSADVRTRGGVFRRPTSKLAVLLVKKEATTSLRRGEDVDDSEPRD